jgi:outer membrane protein TolC
MRFYFEHTSGYGSPMKCKPSKTLIWLLSVSFLATGCTPTRPVYLNESGDLNYYLEQATKIEYPDIETPTLDEVTQAAVPMTVMDPDFESYEDMTLEDAVSYALQNSKVLRGYGTPGLQGTRVSPGVDNLANGPTAAGTIYNVAVRETEPGFLGTAGQIASPSGLTTNTGLDGNQGVEAALADFDAQLTSGVTWSTTDRPRNISEFDVAGNRRPEDFLFSQGDQVQWQAEVAKKAANGTQIFFRNVNTYTDTNNPLNDVNQNQGANSFYQANFEAEVRQPLLRGRGAFINRMPIVISRIGTDQELANLEAQLQNMVTNVEIRYWDLYCAYRNLDAAKTGRNAALETWRIVKDQFDEGADVNVQQVAQASEQYHFFDAQVIDAYNNLLNAEGALRFLLGWSSTDCRMIRPIDEPVMAPVEFDWCTSLCEALTYRPELRQERWEIKKRELALAYSKNGLLPELNATALYRFLGLGNRFGTSGNAAFPVGEPELQGGNLVAAGDQSGALNGLYDGNFQELQVGLNFGMPVGFRRELANVRNAQLKLAREIARIEDMELDVTRELSEAMRALAANQMIMRSSFNRWKDTTIEEEHFQRLKDEGVETLDVALDAQRRRSQAEIAFYTAMCEYNKVIALIHRRKGTTLPYCGVEFSEGPWTGKAYVDAQEHARRRSASRELNYGWTRPQVISRGENRPSGSNNGATYSTGGVVSDPVIYHDSTIVPNEGEIYNGPYYEGEVIQEQPIYQGAPAPTLAPPQYNPVPQGSSSRVHRDTSVRQVSHQETSRVRQPKSSEIKIKATTGQRSASPRKVAAERQPVRGTNDRTAVSSIRPERDRTARPVQRLSASASSTPLRNSQGRSNIGSQQRKSNLSGINHKSASSNTSWEKLGLAGARDHGNETVARIKTIEPSVTNNLR